VFQTQDRVAACGIALKPLERVQEVGQAKLHDRIGERQVVSRFCDDRGETVVQGAERNSTFVLLKMFPSSAWVERSVHSWTISRSLEPSVIGVAPAFASSRRVSDCTKRSVPTL
jgi:hypothetical protein